jgi:23S rRNA (uracil1939-C5)-methyltransferase/tRNA (uracil-5-)-methyltransferase
MAGVEFPVAPVIPSPRDFGYRSKITPHFHPPRAGDGSDELPLPIGFLRQGTRFDIVDVPQCVIST